MIYPVPKKVGVLCLLLAAGLANIISAQAASASMMPKQPGRPLSDNRQSANIQTEKNAMSQSPQSSRPAPPVVKPVEHKGVRYEQDMQSYDHGGDQPGGYLAAVDIKTGERLWLLKVYEVQDNSASGVDSIGLYFKNMALVPGSDTLDIENESGSHFIVDLNAKNSTPVPKPKDNPLPPIKIPK